MSERFIISTDKSLLDMDVIHEFLAACYWSPGIPRHVVERAAANSMCFGVYEQEARRPAPPTESEGKPVQVGYARVITDHATFAYLSDVFVVERCRGLGLSKRLMEVILGHADLQGLRRFCLLTRDAHGVYEPLGFKAMADPAKYMERAPKGEYGPEGWRLKAEGRSK